MTETFFSTMLSMMYSTRKNKRRACDSVDFESEWVHRLVRMAHEMEEKTFRVDHNYAFLVPTPKWREIFATSFEGRIADHLLCDVLAPYIESELHDRTFNNRIGKGSQAAINQVIEDIAEVSNGYSQPARIIKWDLKGFFPNADCSIMEQCFHGLIDRHAEELRQQTGRTDAPEALRWLASVIIHCRPTEHCEFRSDRTLWAEHIEQEKSLFGKPPGIGVPIGRMVSQVGMGLYINDEVRWLNDECGIRTTVFMDDGVMVVPERLHGYALSLIPELRRRLAAKGIRMNDRKFYDQPWQHGLEFLGTHIKSWRLHLNDQTVTRALNRIAEFNAMPVAEKHRFLDKFIATVNSYTGLMKNRTEYRRVQHLRQLISQEWWQWLVWDDRRQCVVCKPNHSYRERLKRKYHLRLHHYDRKRKTDAAERAAHSHSEKRGQS